MSGKSYLSPAKFRIFAHRGTTELGAVENTLRAFSDALVSGADFLETDVQATKDSQVVVFHDDDLKRLLDVSKKVSDLTLSELQGLAHSRGLEIPTLDEVLRTLPDAKFNIDIKVQSAAPSAARAISQLGAIDRVLVSSFSAKRRIAAINFLPGVATSADSKRVVLLLIGLLLRNKRWIDAALRGLDAVQIPTQFGWIRLDRGKLIQVCHERGVEVHYWTINDPAEALRLRGLGADGIVTDRCKLMSMALAE